MDYKRLCFNMAIDLCNCYEIEIDELAIMYCLSNDFVNEFRKYFDEYMGN